MHLLTLVAVIPAALAIEVAQDAGGPQSAPTYTDTSAAPTVATVVTYSGTSSVAPLYTTSSPSGYPVSSPSSYQVSTYPGSSPSTYPVSAPSSYPVSSSYPGSPMSPYPVGNGTTSYPTSAPGNLSTTGQLPSTSVVVATVTGANGQPSTETSITVVTPTGGAPPAPQGTGSTQSGDGSRLERGAAAALAVFGGFLAFML